VDHWYPLCPYRGSEYRCIRLGKGSSKTKHSEIDPVYIKTLSKCGITIEEFLERMPENLTIWIDPGEVSYRIGECGKIKTLYETVASNIYKRLDLNSSDSKNSEVRFSTNIRVIYEPPGMSGMLREARTSMIYR
jgi:hypothetical protein